MSSNTPDSTGLMPTIDGTPIYLPSVPVIYTDRSRIQAREKCPQLRFLSYHTQRNDNTSNILGIQRFGRSVPLATGQAVHHGLAHLALWHLHANGNQGQALGEFPTWLLDEAIQSGLDNYKSLVQSRGFSSGYDPNTSGTIDWIIQEQSAIIEALIYVGAKRVLEPLFNSGHWLLSAEQERKTYLSRIRIGQNNTSHALVYLSRADLEMYDPNANSLYVVNFKTSKQYTDFQAQQLSIGLQTIGEAVALSAAHKSGLDQSLSHVPPDATTAGVQYIYFIKGRQQYDKVRGHDVTYNHLIRAWTSTNHLTGQPTYSWLYFYPDSKRQVLSKSSGFWTFESFPGGTRAWLDTLLSGKVNPVIDPDNGQTLPDPLSEVIRMPGMSHLHPHRQQRWLAQTIEDETFFLHKLSQPDSTFSMHTEQCGYGKWNCAMFPICHELLDINNELFTNREPNHEEDQV